MLLSYLSLGVVKIRPHNFIQAIVTFGDKPNAAGKMVPPLSLDGRLTRPMENVIGPATVVCLIRIRHFAQLATILKFLQGARAVDGASENLHDKQDDLKLMSDRGSSFFSDE